MLLKVRGVVLFSHRHRHHHHEHQQQELEQPPPEVPQPRRSAIPEWLRAEIIKKQQSAAKGKDVLCFSVCSHGALQFLSG